MCRDGRLDSLGLEVTVDVELLGGRETVFLYLGIARLLRAVVGLVGAQWKKHWVVWANAH
jgi:hypothetical protein